MSWLASALGALVKGALEAILGARRQRRLDADQRELGAQDQALRDAATERDARDRADAIRNRPAGSDDELFNRARATREGGS